MSNLNGPLSVNVWSRADIARDRIPELGSLPPGGRPLSHVLHLMGAACSGKSSLIQRLLSIAPNDVYAVEVGKRMRAKYGDRFFKGQAAPKQTQGEAWEMYMLGVREGIAEQKSLIIVDGQPRDIEQARNAIGLWRAPHHSSFLLLHADHEERERRCRADVSDPNRDVESRIARLTNDYRNCYAVMAELLMADQVIRVIDTTKMVDVHALAEQVLTEYPA